MKLIAPAIVLSSLFWASALATPINGSGVTAPINGSEVTAPSVGSEVKAPIDGSKVTAPIDDSEVKAPIDGYGVVIPEWEVEVSPGGPMIKVNGTIQEVHSELLRQNPDWDTQYLTNITEESPSLKKRAFDVAGFNCYGRWGACDAGAISEGAQYLRRVRGLPNMGPGPGNCGRVSCSYKSAIWWCNDARESKTLLGGFGDIADGAVFLINNCGRPELAPFVVAGQVFSTSDWNVIVRRDTNRC